MLDIMIPIHAAGAEGCAWVLQILWIIRCLSLRSQAVGLFLKSIQVKGTCTYVQYSGLNWPLNPIYSIILLVLTKHVGSVTSCLGIVTCSVV